MTSAELLSRRRFLRTAAGMGAGYGVFHTLFDLRLLNNAVAAVNVSDYKALICLFLGGGNDAANMIIPAPADTRYATYYKPTRGARLALWEDQAAAIAATTGTNNPNVYYAAPLSTANTGPDAYAVHNIMNIGTTAGSTHPSVRSLFDAGKLAFMVNTGVLVEPMTRAEYRSGTKKKPPQLFSHNDQVTQWQTSVPDQISRTGWGGRTIDKMRQELAVQGIPPGSISLSVSLAGNNTWEVGDVVNQFQVSTSGAVSFSNYTSVASRPAGPPTTAAIARSVLMDQILRDPANGGDSALDAARVNLTLKDFKAVNERSLLNGASLSTALTRLTAGNPDAAMGTAIDTAFGIGTGGTTYANLSGLEQQLHTIARIIAERGFLGMRRQIFFCSIGGYDTHGDQPVAHAGLLQTLSRAMGRFYQATQNLSVADKCTTFTAADFGRTFKSNSLGTDHAWGNHHMVMGGAVNGGRLFGTYPTLVLGGPDDTDGSGATGRFIPTTSTDQYAATLSRWFGLGEAELDTVFPNLSRFASRDVGFMG
jgi:uncharacterized protein (DUF1501 family)